jgi:hypothetical protein
MAVPPSSRTGRLGTLATAIEQPHADRLLKISNRSGDGGLCRIQHLRRFAHAAGLDDRHQNVKIVKLNPAADAIAQLHDSIHCTSDMEVSINSIIRA